MSNLAHDAQTIRRICEAASEDLKEATQGITVPSRQICQIIAEELRAKAARVFRDDKDLAHELENTADEFESIAL